MSRPQLKSLHITNYYHRNSGGISTSFNNLMAAAERHERPVILVVPGETRSVEEVNPFARIHFVPARYSPIFDKRYRIMMPWQYMTRDSVIREILLEERPDLIEVTDKYTLSMIGAMVRTNRFKRIGRPILVHFSCERMDDNIASFLSEGRMGKWLARRVIGNYTLPSFDFHIANSTYTAEEFYLAASPDSNRRRSRAVLNWCWRTFKAPRVPIAERIFVCPRGVNAAHFSPERSSAETRARIRQAAGIPDDSIALLYAGRLSPEKNIGLLVEMMKLLSQDRDRDFRLLAAGAGPLEDWLKSQAEKHFPGKIVLLGHLDKDSLADHYANCDVFVHPNPKEPFGIAPLEAMASGVPTVAPNSGGILSYASNENAWLVEPTGAEFARAVREVIDNDAVRAAKVAKALETARANTREASTDRLFAAYDKIFADFHERRELYVDANEIKDFDFVTELLNKDLAGSELNRVEL
ncbi:MAG: glycosyltransferase [Chloracidobacterium sp.]|nr:glycosyltransferase [Chloracidobacterium sp.]